MSSAPKTAFSSQDTTPEPIAIIGMGGLFPDAPGLQQYWGLLRTGADAISTVPSSHWDKDSLVRPKGDHLTSHLDYTYSDKGGFLGDLPFDPMEYGIPPTVLEATDTAQLLGLVAGRMALDHAGYTAEREFDRTRTSVILGVTGALELVVPLGARLGHPQWRKAMTEVGIDPSLAQAAAERISDYYVPWQENSFPGLLGNVVAGRIANRLNLRGTNCVVDAACASSLAALHLAVLELRAGHSDMVLCGGVDAFNDIFMFMCFTKTQALSPSGHARPFSPNSDGTVLGEGVGMVVLKRLSDAQRDGDNIRAVILGVGTSSDGRSQSIYAPRSEGQAAALRNAYSQAGVSPRSVELVEAHGTGTKVGDQVEFDALRTVYSESAPNDVQWCTLGSVKSQIGHTKSAAGAASLIKAALALEHKVLPGTLKHDGGNPAMELDKSPFRLGDRTRPWPSKEGQPRRAAVSSFGFGGSNFHTVLQEAGPSKNQVAWDGTVQIAASSGATRQALVERLESLRADLRKDTRVEWRAWLLQQSRIAFRHDEAHRILLVLSGPGEDDSRLGRAVDWLRANHVRPGSEIEPGIWYGEGQPEGDLAFVFPGQGSQYAGMGLDLTCVFPEVQGWIEKMDRTLPGLWTLMQGAPHGQQDSLLSRTDRAQAALGALSAGLCETLLKRFGVRPQALAGHSYGELAALWAAGVFSDSDFVTATRARGQAMAEAGDKSQGSMLAVMASRESVMAVLSQGGASVSDVVPANHNGPEQLVLTGPTTGIEKAESLLQAAGLTARRLPVSGAFHSPAMAPAGIAFGKALNGLGIATPAATGSRVYRCLDGQVMADYQGVFDHLAQQITQPVEWVTTVESMYRDGVRTFVEVGSKAVLSGLIRRILKDKPFEVVPLDPSGGRNDGVLDLGSALCQLAALGFPVQLGAFEATVAEPRKQAMTVHLRGINYRSTPIPPARKPAKVQQTVEITNAPLQTQASVSSAPPMMAAPSAHGTYSAQSTQPQRTDSAVAHNPRNLQSMASSGSSGHHSVSPTQAVNSRSTLEAGLLAIQSMHERTAQVHSQFLQGMQQSQSTLLSLLTGVPAGTPGFNASSSSVLQGSPNSARVPAPLPSTPPQPAQPMAPVAVPPPVVQAAAPPSIPQSVKDNPSPERVTGSDQLAQELLSVVAELTGYPAEMIDLGMDLESDLGIDSIKRVEILAAIQRRVPSLPPVDSTRLGSLRTLHEVLSELVPAGGQAVPLSSTGNPGSSAQGLSAALIEVVSELTGYPGAMIELSMDLESDLGIDSIKRVEILAAVQRRMPELPTVDSSRLGSLRTLAEIIQALSSESPAGTPIPTVNPSTNPSSLAALESTMVNSVAELTGYPVAMIELGMDLEGDLGIDSIKRVEILAAVQRQMPELPSIDSTRLGSLRTLKEIINAYSELQAGTPTPAENRPAASVAGSEASGLMEALLNVVSELTGYPEDMIDPTMDLEADLGIDSIKRVEILAAAQRLYPGLSRLDSSQLNSRSTLQAIVDLAQDVLDVAPKAISVSSPAKQTVPAPPPSPVERRILKQRSVPVSAVAHFPLPSGARLAVVSEAGELADALIHILRSEGYVAELVVPGHGSVDPAASGIILVGTHLTRAQSHSGWTESDEAWINKAFVTVQSAHGQLNQPSSPTLFATVSALNGCFGLGEQHRPLWNPVAGSLAALAKTAAQEWEHCQCVAVDVAPSLLSEAGLLASRILPAMSAALTQSLVEIGVTPSEFITVELEQKNAVRGNSSPHLQNGDLIVVLGGARGVTVDCLESLVREVRLKVVLTGRTVLQDEPAALRQATTTAEIRTAVLGLPRQGKATPAALEREVRQVLAVREVHQTMDRLRKAGAESVEYRNLDVANADAVADLFHHLAEEVGPIRGLIHAAGVIEDRLISDKTAEQFAKVWNTKVPALRIALDTLDLQALRAVALFSSVSARFGNTGQVDYAMANEALNKCAAALSHQIPGCRVVSCNWGPWDGGMVSPELKRAFEARGVSVIDLRAGALAFVDELLATSESAAVEVVLGKGLNHGGHSNHPAHTGESKSVISAAPPSAGHQQALPTVLSRPVDVHSHPFLNSHVLAGRAVLPMAMMAEWMSNAALASQPGLHIHELRDLRVLRGLKLNGETVHLNGGCRAGEFADGLQRVDLDLSSNLGIHARVQALLSTQRPEDLSLPQGIFRALGDFGTYPLTMEEAYRTQLFHGPDFQGITAITGIGPKGLRASVRTAPAPTEWMANPVRKRWIIDPMLVDTVLQAGILLTQHLVSTPCLPSHVESLVICNTPPGPDTNCILELGVTQLESHRLVADAVILDGPAGRPLLALKGVEWTIDGGLRAAFAQNGQTAAGHTH